MRLFIVAMVLLISAQGLHSQPSQYSVQPLLPKLKVSWSNGMAHSPEGKLFVADKGNHRILVLENDALVGVIGRIGQGPGEFYKPASLSYRNGRLYIVEQSNYRVQILDSNGVSQSIFPVSFVLGYVGASSDGRILLNDPGSGYLFTTYSAEGGLKSRHGSLLTEKEAFPRRANGSKNPISLNRVHLHADHQDNVITVFQFVPIVQKWSLNGAKLWERRLDSPEVESLVRGLWNEPKGSVYSNKSVAGEPQMPLIISASCLTAQGDVLVVLADLTLFWLSNDGQRFKRFVLKPKPEIVFHAVTEYEGNVYFASASGLFRSVGSLAF